MIGIGWKWHQLDHMQIICTSLQTDNHASTSPLSFFYRLDTLPVVPPFPQIDIIGEVVIVWRVRGKIIRSVLFNIVCNNCAQCNAHTCEQTNSSLDWVLSHWAHFTVLRFIFVYVCKCVFSV